MRIDKVTKRKTGAIHIRFFESSVAYGTTLIVTPEEIINMWKLNKLVNKCIDTFRWAKAQKGNAYKYAVEDLDAMFREFKEQTK